MTTDGDMRQRMTRGSRRETEAAAEAEAEVGSAVDRYTLILDWCWCWR